MSANDPGVRSGGREKEVATLLEVALALARREFGARVDLEALGGETDLVELAATLNMLGEELEASTVAVEELEAANALLARKNEELDEFSYIASHDLQAPLRNIITMADLLRLQLGSGLDEESRECMDLLVEAAFRMQKLVQDLLTLSRTGRADLSVEEIGLDSCLDAALDALAAEIRDRNVTIDRDALPRVLGARTQLVQLFQNLIANAIKFNEADLPHVWITVETNDGDVVMGVKDNGIGIKQEYTSKIFAPFTRLHGATEYGGTGIGLAICRKVVERHGGRLWVESEVGKGSHFRFTLEGVRARP